MEKTFTFFAFSVFISHLRLLTCAYVYINGRSFSATILTDSKELTAFC